MYLKHDQITGNQMCNEQQDNRKFIHEPLTIVIF